MLGYPPWTYQLEISKKMGTKGDHVYDIYIYIIDIDIDSLWLFNRAMENRPFIDDI